MNDHEKWMMQNRRAEAQARAAYWRRFLADVPRQLFPCDRCKKRGYIAGRKLV